MIIETLISVISLLCAILSLVSKKPINSILLTFTATVGVGLAFFNFGEYYATFLYLSASSVITLLIFYLAIMSLGTNFKTNVNLKRAHIIIGTFFSISITVIISLSMIRSGVLDLKVVARRKFMKRFLVELITDHGLNYSLAFMLLFVTIVCLIFIIEENRDRVNE